MMLHQNEGFESWDVYQWKGSIFQCGRSFFKIWLFTDIYNYIHEPKESQSFQTFILVNWTMCPLWMGKIRDNFQGIPFSCWCSKCLPLLVYFKDWNHRTIGPQRGIFSTRSAAKPLSFFPITVKHSLSRKKP